MDVKLIKKLVVLNQGKSDEKRFYAFYLRLGNGSQIKIQPNSYEDKKTKKKTSNYNELLLIASDELPFDK